MKGSQQSECEIIGWFISSRCDIAGCRLDAGNLIATLIVFDYTNGNG